MINLCCNSDLNYRDGRTISRVAVAEGSLNLQSFNQSSDIVYLVNTKQVLLYSATRKQLGLTYKGNSSVEIFNFAFNVTTFQFGTVKVIVLLGCQLSIILVVHCFAQCELLKLSHPPLSISFSRLQLDLAYLGTLGELGRLARVAYIECLQIQKCAMCFLFPRSSALFFVQLYLHSTVLYIVR